MGFIVTCNFLTILQATYGARSRYHAALEEKKAVKDTQESVAKRKRVAELAEIREQERRA